MTVDAALVVIWAASWTALPAVVLVKLIARGPAWAALREGRTA